MRNAVLTIIMMAAFTVSASGADVTVLRRLYYTAHDSKAAAEQLLQETERADMNDPLVCCYKGMALMMKASYGMNPYSKLTSFNKGKALVEQAVRIAPANAEIRFLRFCAQTNAPSFLGYNEEIDTDKNVILRLWRTINDMDLKEKIRKYMIASAYCNKDEKSVLL